MEPAKHNGGTIHPASPPAHSVMIIFRHLLAGLLLAATPLALPALSTIDGRIEAAARQTYNFRIVLEGAVRIRVHQGQATLTGYVSDAEARTLAQETVEHLPEVIGVTNSITVAPRYPVNSDSWLTDRIRHRLLVQANISPTTTVSVYHGVATLGGTAISPAHRELAGLCAGGVGLVVSVTNNITVKASVAPAEQIDDASITSLGKSALRGHRDTSALTPTILTVGGAVQLTGEAASEIQKSLVTQLVRDVRGAASVTNDMTVKP